MNEIYNNIIFECTDYSDKKYDYEHTVFFENDSEAEFNKKVNEAREFVLAQKNVKSAKVKTIYKWE